MAIPEEIVINHKPDVNCETCVWLIDVWNEAKADDEQALTAIAAQALAAHVVVYHPAVIADGDLPW